MSVLEDFSGVIVNQNTAPGLTDFWPLTSTQIYQEFFLPSDIVRGEDSDEQRSPALSGFQLAVTIPTGTEADASFDWVLERNIFGVGWLPMDEGTVVGAHASGNRVWMNVYFTNAISIDSGFQTTRFRIGILGRGAVAPTAIWYTTPNPLAESTAYARQADGFTQLGNFSFLFRVLALSADDGTDFLGNRYRSVVVTQDPNNVSTRDGAVKDKYWLSKPNPSRFAVESLYFDVRQPAPATYGGRNLIPSPSFELVGFPGWAQNAATGSYARVTGGRYGQYAAQQTNPGTNADEGLRTNSILVSPSKTYTAGIWLKGNVGGEQVRLVIRERDTADAAVGVTTSNLTLTTNWTYYTATRAFGATGTKVRLGVEARVTAAMAFQADGAIITEGSTATYFDGDMPSHVWGDLAHNSVSVEVTSPGVIDESAVIDRVLLDPLTPGIYFHVYYTDEGEAGTTDAEWDSKLWKVAPRTFHATKREAHVLPEPIRAKFIKVEFTHLQAKHYAPGDFAKPITYRKHPKWVLDYFLARLSAQQEAQASEFGVRRVGVIFDALDIAYNYYLDDLAREPNKPVEVTNSTAAAASLAVQGESFVDQIDQTTLDQINLSMQPYQERPSVFTKNNFILSDQTATLDDPFVGYPVEGRTPGTPAFVEIQSLRNREVLFENDYPVMYFYLTCRHGYRELTANFSHDRAYFAGINEIAFTRERYTQAHDNTQYIEPGVDVFNIERNDFVNDGTGMVVQHENVGSVFVDGVEVT
jgi:hypothetical protein